LRPLPFKQQNGATHMATLQELAANLEHFATVLHDQARRSNVTIEPEIFAELDKACNLLDTVTFDISEQEETARAIAETELDLSDWLNGDAVRAALKEL
jgi:3-hydroxyisobutyrate dehydrogenase-like beta-hydroxyacid dehydrogenase